MPEMTFSVRWPDGRVVDHYSPSLVVHDHLTAGSTYPVDDFRERPSLSVLIRNLEQNRPARIAQAHGLTIIGELTGIGSENILNAEEGFRIGW